jgi:hypothetical protein
MCPVKKRVKGCNPSQATTLVSHFLVIAAPRPSGFADLEIHPGKPNRGALFLRPDPKQWLEEPDV